jgi:hypothetical protein
MKILVVAVEFAAPEALLEEEDLPNVRRLMEAGCFGRLDGADPPVSVPGWERFGADAVHRVDAGRGPLADGAPPPPDALRRVDEEIGRVLESLEGETAVLVVSLHGAGSNGASVDGRAKSGGGAFVLAAPAVTPLGAIEGACRADLEATLLALRGGELPADCRGRNLLAAAASAAGDATDDEEERLVKERLAGLGYI